MREGALADVGAPGGSCSIPALQPACLFVLPVPLGVCLIL